MSYFVNPVEDDQCVFLSYEGKLPPGEVLTSRFEANGLLAAKCWNRMVVDVTELQSIPAAQELFELARGLASDLPPSARVALVTRPEQARHAKLVETVARHDGIFLTCFFEPEKAAAWVKGLSLFTTHPQAQG